MATRISLLIYSIKTLDSPKDISATFAWAQDIDDKAIPRNDPATTGELVLQYPHRNRILPLLSPLDNGHSTQSKTGTKHHLFGSCSGNQISEVRARIEELSLFSIFKYPFEILLVLVNQLFQ